MMTMPLSVAFRTMTLTDIPGVLELERATYPEPWSEGIFSDELSRTDRIYLIAEHDGVMVGFGGLMFVDQDAHVTTLAVDAGVRNSGLGTRLMLQLIGAGMERGAQNLTLEVRATNESALRLYNRFGMVAVGVRKHYYRDDDAVIMWATDINQSEYTARLDGIRRALEEQS